MLCAMVASAGHAVAGSTEPAPAACSRQAPVKAAPASVTAIPNVLALTKTKKRSAACFVTAASIMARASDARPLFVDVRDSIAFEQFRIPGSLNVPLHAIKTKRFLKSHALVLVNEGRSPSELQAACNELKKDGFGNVAVLSGGLKAWRASGGALEGEIFPQDKLDLIPPAQLFEEAAYDDWLILSVAAVNKTELRKWLPHAEPLGRAYQKKMMLASRVKAVAASRKMPVARLNVVIVDDDGSQREKINAITDRQKLKNVFYLEGGLQGYREFLRSQAAVWHHVDNPPRQQACRG